jgi:septum formation topological specificity factor MinE
MAEYKIGKRARVCCVSGSTFAPGDAIVSAIYVAPDGAFERRDMRDTHFDPAAEKPFCHWRSIEPDPDEPGRKLDYDLAMSFFDRLLNEANPTREGLLYTLTLLLSRKRRVRIQESRRLPEGDLLRVLVRRAEEDDEVSVRAPRLNDEDVDTLQAELETLFDFDGNGAPQPTDPA